MSLRALLIPLKQNYNFLFVEESPDELAGYFTRNDVNDGLMQKSINAEVTCSNFKAKTNDFFNVTKDVFSHLHPREVTLHSVPTAQRFSGTIEEIIAKFVKVTVLACMGLDPEISDDLIRNATSYKAYFTGKDTKLITKRSLERIFHYLEKLEKLDPLFLIFFGICTDYLSDGSFKLSEAFPAELQEKVDPVKNGTLYFHPKLTALVRKKYFSSEYISLASRAKEVHVLYDYKDPGSNKEEVEEFFFSPEDILRLVEIVAKNKTTVKWRSNFVNVKDEYSFVWTLVYVFTEILKAQEKRETSKFPAVTTWKRKNSSELKDALPSMAELYSRYVELVSSLENFSTEDRELFILLTHTTLVDEIVNARELNLVFLNHFLQILSAGDEKNKPLRQLIKSVIKNRKVLLGFCEVLTSLNKEDAILVESLATIRKKASIPAAVFLFYPWIAETKVYRDLINAVSKQKNEATLYFTAFEHLTRREKDENYPKELNEVRTDLENEIQPDVAFTLVKKKIISDKLLEKSKAFTLAGGEYKEVYDKAACLNVLGVKNFPDALRKVLEITLTKIGVLTIEDFMILGKKLGKILNDEEFRVMTRLVTTYTNGHFIYVVDKAPSQATGLLFREENIKTLYSALKKIAEEAKNIKTEEKTTN